ncbi:alpha/beta hydrolase [Haliea sp. E1-2-M8]|uniref:alpha/beta hydrolase n=1 Tax=Haliea sp. E1-2-M8 TaxID=3064706 RepID=UPI00271B3E8E|nr:alpha/beta hydrolase [Haliea sp. E1-2-M8]MDO8862063.1 alpha/beta hydrolase [Haliea sp. E1-2-M8]
MSRSALLQQIIDAVPMDFADPAADYRTVRATMAPFHSQPVSADVLLEEREYGGVRCGVYRLPGQERAPLALHCHGGAFVSCPLDHYHFYGEIIARHAGCQVVMPDYRLAPEHPWPAAHDDCFSAYSGLLDSGVDPRRLVVMGESCGGSLGLGLLLRARDAGLPMPAAFVSVTGWFDLAVAGPHASERDPFLTADWVRNRGRDYLAGKLPLDDPRVSPASAALAGLAPLYLQVAQHDTMRQGALKLASRAVRAGVEVSMESWPGMIHGWHGLVNSGVEEAVVAWARIRDYIAWKTTSG